MVAVAVELVVVGVAVVVVVEYYCFIINNYCWQVQIRPAHPVLVEWHVLLKLTVLLRKNDEPSIPALLLLGLVSGTGTYPFRCNYRYLVRWATLLCRHFDSLRQFNV